MDERTFAVALRTLMDGQPGAAAVAFGLLHAAATDSLVRSRARIGLTMALSYDSDWQAMARLRAIPNAADSIPGSLAVAAGVERWARALSMIPTPVFEIPDQPVVLPMRRSFLGTPVVTIRINGKPHEFWLDTGASMTLLSTDVAIAAGAKLAAEDTLALGVVGGHIEARAIYIDSMAIGPVTVRGLGAALVSPEALRFDQKLVNGLRTTVPIDGMIGTDVLRHLDVVMDARAGTITLRRPHRYAGARRNLFWVGYPVVRLVTPDGRPVLFGLDTGAEGTYVTNTLLKKAPRTPVAMRRNSLVGLGSDTQALGEVELGRAAGSAQRRELCHHAEQCPDHAAAAVDLRGLRRRDRERHRAGDAHAPGLHERRVRHPRERCARADVRRGAGGEGGVLSGDAEMGG